MKKIFKYSLAFAAAMTLTFGVASCGNDDIATTPTTPTTTENKYDASLQKVNEQFVDSTVIPTYRTLADYNDTLWVAVKDLSTDEKMQKACDAWKKARKYWEFSESFLFGAAKNLGIDPHIDTWPFAEAQFLNMLSRFENLTDEDKDNIDEIVSQGQNLTGFHAIEYILFRDGKARSAAELSDVEDYFVQAAAEDLYYASLKLVYSWGGKLTDAENEYLFKEKEWELTKDYEIDFKNAGKLGSNYSSVALAARQIISGASEIVGEVADAKIGKPTHGEDVNYIESPHSYNSIQDFYDNIMSCKHSLYGGLNVNGTTPAEGSLIQFCLDNDATKAAAKDVMAKLEIALEKVNAMERPFVQNYRNQSALDAITALKNFNTSLGTLDNAIQSLYTE